jgi:hypothetical protein
MKIKINRFFIQKKGLFLQNKINHLKLNQMKSIYFSFGYMGTTIWNMITYKLCKLLPFIPTLECDLFKTFNNSKTPFIVRHSIYLGWLNFYFRISKTKGKWKFDNLSDK